ncbi:MAG: type II secretion system protein [Planctomycetia bacterium]|nr:type II secretion system protein [Planctomycetia bacterium]
MKTKKTIKKTELAKQGFTLVELLVVIMIIAVLSGITVTVFRQAKETVKSSLVAADLTQISIALDQYKARYGEYPPDFSDEQAVMRHVRKRWPRYGVTNATEFKNHIAWGSALSSKDPAGNSQCIWDITGGVFVSPLVFWLGGLPDANGIPRGFYLSPTAPLGYKVGAADATKSTLPANNQREEPLYTFDEKNCVNIANSANTAAIPFLISGKLPIVYFKATSNTLEKGAYANIAGDITGKTLKFYDFTTALPLWTGNNELYQSFGIAVPYGKKEANGTIPMVWYEEDRFQLVHPGEDGSFGMPIGTPAEQTTKYATWAGTRKVNVAFPTTVLNFTKEDADNITNFLSSGTTLAGEQQ